MPLFRPAAATILLAFICSGCRTAADRSAVDPELAAAIPSSAQIVAGVQLKALRASALYARLPEATSSLFERADSLLVALTAQGLLTAAHGDFPQAPAGATLLSPRVAISGSPDAVREASAAFRARPSVVPELIPLAEPVAASHPLWIVARGSATLPLTGNLANFNNLLHATSYTTLGAQLSDPLTLEAAGVCRSPEAAKRLEETFRALLSLASAGRVHSPVLDSIRYHTEGPVLRISASAPITTLDFLWR